MKEKSKNKPLSEDSNNFYEKLTLKSLKAFLKKLDEMPREPYIMTLAADDYDMLSDDEFRALCRSKDVKFVGGMKGCHRMFERMKKLKIT